MGTPKGKIVLITGVPFGIGLKAVEEFLSMGDTVIFWGLAPSVVNKRLLEHKHYEYCEVDIADLQQVTNAAKEIFSNYKRIDILINDAHAGYVDESSNSEKGQWQKIIDRQLTAVFNCIKVVAPYMVGNKFGRIINATSMAHISQSLDQTNYDATKSGLQRITSVWARELSKHGITVNAVYSGFIEPDTDVDLSKNDFHQLCAKIPARRLGTAAEIAKTYRFLASEDASYISGAVLYVDGGYFA